MPEARHQVTIQRPAGEVFAFIADGLNGTKWRYGISTSPHLREPGRRDLQAGREGTGRPPGRRRLPGHRLRAGSPPRVRGDRRPGPPDRRVRPRGGRGGTRLTFALRAELGGIKKLLMGGAVQKTMDAEVAATERLKEILEATGKQVSGPDTRERPCD